MGGLSDPFLADDPFLSSPQQQINDPFLSDASQPGAGPRTGRRDSIDVAFLFLADSQFRQSRSFHFPSFLSWARICSMNVLMIIHFPLSCFTRFFLSLFIRATNPSACGGRVGRTLRRGQIEASWPQSRWRGGREWSIGSSLLLQ